MDSFINEVEFNRIRNRHGREVAEKAQRGEYPLLVKRMRRVLKVSDPDSEEIEKPARPVVEKPSPDKEEPPTGDQPILNPIQAQFARIAWAVQARRKRPVTQAELEIIRDGIYFGGNFFASMGMLERINAIVRDDDGTTIRYRINKPRFFQLQDADDEIISLAVKRPAAESP